MMIQVEKLFAPWANREIGAHVLSMFHCELVTVVRSQTVLMEHRR
jgi:hypothetical protein